MVYHYKDDIKHIKFTLDTPLSYSKEYTFIPINVKSNECKKFMIQTPKMFTPFGIQENMNSKDYIMISFKNSINDPYTKKFYNDLTYLFSIIENYFKDKYKINPFLKPYQETHTMNLKLKENAPIFNLLKETCEELPIYSYASYIIYLAGLWIHNDEIWFQWYNLQTRIETDIQTSTYLFKESRVSKPNPIPIPPPPPLPKKFRSSKNKYDKMLSMGIPKGAVTLQKNIDRHTSISSDMLKSVKLKKMNHKKINTDMNGFEPPSLDSLQKALQNLRNIITQK